MKEDIVDILLCVGVPAGTKGFSYIQDALDLLDADPDHFSGRICALYERVAARHGASAAQVERAIRYAFEAALTRGRPELVAYYLDPVNARNSHLLRTLYLRWKQGERPDRQTAALSGDAPTDPMSSDPDPAHAAPTALVPTETVRTAPDPAESRRNCPASAESLRDPSAPTETARQSMETEIVRIYPDPEESVRIYPDPAETIRIYPDPVAPARRFANPAEAVRIYQDILAELRMMAAYLQTPPARPGVAAAAGGTTAGSLGRYAAESGEAIRDFRADSPVSSLAAYPPAAHLCAARPLY